MLMMMITWNKWMTLHKYRSKPPIQNPPHSPIPDGVRTNSSHSLANISGRNVFTGKIYVLVKLQNCINYLNLIVLLFIKILTV